MSISTRETIGLKLVGVLAEDAENGTSLAIDTLGHWLVPGGSNVLRTSAAKDLLQQRVPDKRSEGDAWTVAGLLRREGTSETRVRVHALTLDGSATEIARFTAPAAGVFCESLTCPMPAIVRLDFEDANGRLGSSGPLKADANTWIYWTESPNAVDRRGGEYEICCARLLQLAGATSGTAGAAALAQVDPAALAAASGLALAEARRHARASTFSAQLGVSDAVGWVLLGGCERAGVAASDTWLDDCLDLIANQLPSTIRDQIEAAINTRQISAEHASAVPRVLANHRRLRVRRWLGRRAGDARESIRSDSTWADVIRSIGATDADVEEAADVADGEIPSMWERFRLHAASEGSRARDPRQCDLASWVAIVRYDHRALDLLAKAGVPHVESAVESRSHEDLALHLSALGDDLRQAVHANLDEAFPGHAVLWDSRKDLGDEAKPLYDAGLLDLERLTVALWHDSTSTSIRLSAIRGKAVPIPRLDPSSLARVQRLQRLHRVGKTKAATLALANAGYDSAHEIALDSEPNVVRRLAEQGVDAPLSRQLRSRAIARQRATTSLYVDHAARQMNLPTVPPDERLALDATIASIPTLTTLFGPQDYCACDECGSVVGQAAYLVDQLMWLDRAPVSSGSSAYATLVGSSATPGRRRDVAELELTCANTDTLVPHIDLVCELLEDRAADALHVPKLRPRQTRGAQADVRAYPEHLNTAVYAGIASAQRPGYWPFDPLGAETRAYLEQRNSTRREVVAAYGDENESDREELALSAAQLSLSVQASETDVAQTTIWGNAPADLTVADVLRRASEILGKALTYEDLQLLLRLPFVCGTDVLDIRLLKSAAGTPPVDACRARDRRIVRVTNGVTAPLTAVPLDRLYRLLRLARALQWAPSDVACILLSLNAQVDAPSLAAAKWIVRELTMAPLEIAVWLGPFDANAASPLGVLSTQLFSTRGLPSNDLTTALAALGVGSAFQRPFLQSLGLISSAATPDTLAKLFRYVRLAEVLGLPPTEFLAEKDVLGDPFNNGIQSAKRFVQDHRLVVAAGIKPGVLEALCKTPSALDGLEALWNALLDVMARYPLGQTGAPPANPDSFKDGVWREPIRAWLNVSGGSAGPALDLAASLFEQQIRVVLAWPTWDRSGPRPQPTAPNPNQLVALQTLWRFGVLFAVTASRQDALPMALNPAVMDVAAKGDWASMRNYLLYSTAGAGAMFMAAPLFQGDPGLDVAPRLAQALTINSADAEALLTDLGAGTRADGWAQVALRAALSTRLNLSPSSLRAAGTPLSESTLAIFRAGFQASTDRAQWLSVSAEAQNRLRVRRRDALLEFLGAFTSKTASDLSAELAIDVETGPLRERSRIGEACAAIENFVTRMELGEESVDRDLTGTSAGEWSQWTWRRRYATWRGNRLIFLFPENYMTVAARSTTTPLFKAFQQSVSRGSMTEENVSDAIVGYLSGLTELADLEYVAVGSDYTHDPDDFQFATQRAFGVIARSRGVPGKYFFNHLRSGSWDYFEELSLGEDPSHVSLFTRMTGAGEQNILVWPKSTLFPRPNQIAPKKDADSPATEVVLATKYAWMSRDESAAWSPARTTSGATLFNGAKVTQRAMFLEPIAGEGSLKPGEFKVVTHFYDPPNPDTTGPRAGEIVGEVSLRNDTTRKTLYRASTLTSPAHSVWSLTAQPETWGGPSPADELARQFSDTAIALFDPAKPRTYSQTWSGLTFDQNRMVTISSKSGVISPLVVPGTAAPLIPTPSTAYSVVAVLWRPVSSSTTDRGLTPSPWAFAVSGPSWSFFVVQKDTWTAAKGGKEALGLLKDSFGSQPFAAVAGYHPFAYALLARAKADGLSGVFQRAVQRQPGQALGVPARRYKEDLGLNSDVVFVPSNVVGTPSLQESIDFSGLAPHQTYNWEVFFHAPVQVAVLLHASKRYEEARRFFHYVFNPAERSVPRGLGRQWWITAAFDDGVTDKTTLAQILRDGMLDGTGYSSVEVSPFDPHKVATQRRSAYERYVVIEYIRNLLDWGDSVYAEGGSENVDEADQLYSLAASMMGPPPLRILPTGSPKPLTFADPKSWRAGGNVLVPLENLLDGTAPSPAHSTSSANEVPVALPLLATDTGGSLYFSVPRNEALRALWDRVEQAQVKVRAWRSLDANGGLVTDVDVAALVAAAAMGGASLRQALSPLTQSALGPRFRVLVAKAVEFCADARALSASVLTACEKRDSAALEGLRSRWEGRVLGAARAAIEGRRTEATREREALRTAHDAAIQRRDYYRGLADERTTAAEETSFGLNIAGATLAGVASLIEVAAAPATAFPDLTIGVSGAMGSPVSTIKIGGGNIGGGLQAAARGLASVGGLLDRTAGLVATQAAYDRRAQEWDQQSLQAEYEADHLSKQLVAAQARIDIATSELAAHDVQLASWSAQDDFIRSKFTTEDRYAWLLDKAGSLCLQAFELASEMGMRAAAAYAFEAPRGPAANVSSIQWSAANLGLMAADDLALALRQMEADHLRFATYDFLAVRKFALKQLAPAQLLALRSGGKTCSIPLPTWWLARLDPGMHNRRVRSLSVSVPCVGGPNASVNARLDLATAGSSLPVKSIVLGSGVNDYGCDTSQRAERYMPFEGLVLDDSSTTTWQLTLPQFSDIDPATIADVVLQIEYGADAGEGTGASVPPDTWPITLDLARDAADAWQDLRATRSATLDPSRFLPSVLSDKTSPAAASITLRVMPGAQPGSPSASVEHGVVVLTAQGVDFSKVLGATVTWNMSAPGSPH